MRWKRCTVVVILATLGLTMTLVLWPARRVPPSVETLRIAESRQIMSALLYIAQEENYYADEGLEVILQPSVSGKASLAEVIAQRVDIAAVAEVPFMRAVREGQPVQVFATIQTSDKDVAIMARLDAGINTPADLAGKRIGAIPGTASAYFLELFLALHGLRDTSIVVPFEPTEVVEALATGRVDAVSAWTTLRLQAHAQLPNRTISFSRDGLYTETWNLAAHKALLHERPVAMQKLLRALLKAEQFLRANRSQAVDIIARLLQLDREKVGEFWDNYGFTVRLDQALVVNLEGQERALRHTTPTEPRPNFLQALSFDGLAAVAPQRITVPR